MFLCILLLINNLLFIYIIFIMKRIKSEKEIKADDWLYWTNNKKLKIMGKVIKVENDTIYESSAYVLDETDDIIEVDTSGKIDVTELDNFEIFKLNDKEVAKLRQDIAVFNL